MTVDFETKCEQTALDYIKIHLQEGYLVTAYKDAGNYYWESVYKIRASLCSNRKTKGDDDDFQNDSSASHNLRAVEDGDEKPLKGSERLLKGCLVKSPQKSRGSHEIAKTENSSEKPNNCEPQTNPFAPPYDNCKTCKWWNDIIGGFGECFVDECEYEPKDEPQTIKVGMATDSVTGKVLGITADTDCAWK